MFSRLTAPVTNRPASKAAPAEKGVPELLSELADIRARKAELEQREKELMAAARARLLQEQQALEQLKKKVFDSGIEFNEAAPAPASTGDNSTPPAQPAHLGN
jgi:hypothetical protein